MIRTNSDRRDKTSFQYTANMVTIILEIKDEIESNNSNKHRSGLYKWNLKNDWRRAVQCACATSPSCCVSVGAGIPHSGGWSRTAASLLLPPSPQPSPFSFSSSPKERKAQRLLEEEGFFWTPHGPLTEPHPQLKWNKHSSTVAS